MVGFLIFLLFISVKDGPRTNREISSSSECPVSTNVPESSQGVGRAEDPHHQREEEKD